MELTHEQLVALHQLKSRVCPISPSYMNSDHDLIRWLKARSFNVDEAEEMLRKHLKWRKEWEIDSILEWKPPEVMTKYYPVGHSGFDKDGDPVWIIRYGLCDIRGLLYSCTKRDFIKFCLHLFEYSLEMMRKKSEAQKVATQCESLILDLENFTLRQFVWRPALDAAFTLAPMFDENYPEVLKCVYVVNAPMIFSITFSMMKPFMNEETINKVKVHGSSGWKDVLLKYINVDQIPAHYGGTMIDPDGDTTCPSKICPGGEVPKSYYLKSKNTEDSVAKLRENLNSLLIPKSGKEEFALKVEFPGTELRWLFQSDEFDIGFGISRTVSSSGNQEDLIPIQRVNSHIAPEEGSFICIDPGTYKITFDNEFSYLRPKQVYYSIELNPPSEHTKL